MCAYRVTEPAWSAEEVVAKPEWAVTEEPRAEPEAREEAPEVEMEEVDQRSVYIGQVDYDCSPEELKEHFEGAGKIRRVTILVNSHTGQPKGYAYIEFADVDSMRRALELDATELRGRTLKVREKRTNVPGMKATRSAPPPYPYMPFRGRGRGFRGFSSRGRRGRGAPRAAPY